MNSSVKKVLRKFHLYKYMFYHSWGFQKVVIRFQIVFSYGNITNWISTLFYCFCQNYVISNDLVNMVDALYVYLYLRISISYISSGYSEPTMSLEALLYQESTRECGFYASPSQYRPRKSPSRLRLSLIWDPLLNAAVMVTAELYWIVSIFWNKLLLLGCF